MISLKLSTNFSSYFCSMKLKERHVSVKNGFSIIGLVVLLLLSPCKIRHVVQDFFDVPQTEVSSKNKTTPNFSCCQLRNLPGNDTKTSSLSRDIVINTNETRFQTLCFNTSIKFTNTSETRELPTGVPLYILYQHLKVHL